MVQCQQNGTVSVGWYSVSRMVQCQQDGTVSVEQYSVSRIVQCQQNGTVSVGWYSGVAYKVSFASLCKVQFVASVVNHILRLIVLSRQNQQLSDQMQLEAVCINKFICRVDIQKHSSIEIQNVKNVAIRYIDAFISSSYMGNYFKRTLDK